MKKIAMGLVVLTLAAGSAGAAYNGVHSDWINGPVKFLMTSEEMKQFKALKSDADAQAFIDLFWARRDPTPATPRNEFHEEFDLRVDYADKYFTTPRLRGATSDRGKTLVLLGSPFRTGSNGAAMRAPGNPNVNPGGPFPNSVDVAGPRGASATMSWFYANEKKPTYVKRKDFQIDFADDRGGGEYEFAITPRNNPEAIFEEAVRGLIVSPDLTKAPEYAAAAPAAPVKQTAIKDPALKTQFDQFRAGGKNIGVANLTWGEFVTPDGDHFVPVALYFPSSSGMIAGKAVTFLTVVENTAGEIVEVVEEPGTLTASGADTYIDRSLRLDPGTYVASVGVADAGQIVAMAKTDMKVEGLDPNAVGISNLILSNNVFGLPQAQKMTDPFAFGGLKVVPKGDGQFVQKEDIWYVYELRNPGLTEAGTPKMQVKIEISGKTDANQPVKFALPLQEIEAQEMKGVKNHYTLAMAFPLADFEPGQYTVKIRVVDSVLKKSYDTEGQFHVSKS